MQLPAMKDSLKRDEKTFMAEIWPTLNEIRMQDKELGSMMKVQFGKAVQYWQAK